ncbi:MAG: uracil-DNA glycosylase family protein [Chloroflexi bacterium]|jgi:uracil-DNA glycosylase|nr:uracil-DNA glycosylase family protein [Chloroflexota bacterium]MBT3670922.1 uracil-DNA glycosylase family protein [Chloroflexota bacterium]MBT4002751.1 uracil-DNA glycosylase family protein [Chloroflexota bacterium]MBT4306364.1 uracil-DNA glycosylase family protein [Chloroflexota bacterium]MBT4532755.1 uracil-DNA glycosylase family protein [Chloroflexota bacterium]
MAIKEDVFAELQSKIRSCSFCLDAGHWVAPPGVTQGDVEAKIMTIGQAPGITEVEVKRPFNAGSGKRLFEWLAKADIDEIWFRSTQYMSSVTKCYPGRVEGGSGDRVPSRAEQALCRPFLDEEIRLVNPKLIILIGRLAIGLYFPKKLKLTEIIGTQTQLENGSWVVPLPHSSGASRWHQIAENRLLIDQAIGLIQGHKKRIFKD